MVFVPCANFQNDSGGLPSVSFGNLPGSLNSISLYYGHWQWIFITCSSCVFILGCRPCLSFDTMHVSYKHPAGVILGLMVFVPL